MLARQEVVTAFENDKPTRDKTRKIKAEKNLPAAVDAIVELHTLGEAHLTGVRTLHWDVKPGESARFPDFSIDTLLRRLGYEDAATTRQVTESRPEAYLQEEDQQQPPQQNRQQTQQQAPAPDRATAPPPGLTEQQAVNLIHQALTDETDPEGRLRAIRAEWGARTLKQVPATTKMWGEKNADDLITVCLAHIKDEAEKRKAPGDGKQAPGPNASTPPDEVGQEQAREHTETPGPALPSARPQPEQPPLDEDGTPPPPDPQAQEPPPPETPEETSAAEEPQDLPAPPPAPRKRPASRAEAMARQALWDESEIQARVRSVTVGEHLGPIEVGGEPGLGELRDFVQQHRPAVIALLEEAA